MAKWFRRGDGGSEASEPEPWWRVDEDGISGDAPAASVESTEPAHTPDVSSEEIPDADAELPELTSDSTADQPDAVPAEVATEMPAPVEPEAPPGESVPTLAAAGSASFMAGLTGRFRRKKEQSSEQPLQPAEQPAEPLAEQPAEQPAPVDEPPPGDQPPAVEELAAEDLAAADVVPIPLEGETTEAPEAGPEFPVGPPPTVSMPETRPGLLGGLRGMLWRSKSPGEAVAPVFPPAGETVPEPAEGASGAEVAAVVAGAGVAAVAAEGAAPPEAATELTEGEVAPAETGPQAEALPSAEAPAGAEGLSAIGTAPQTALPPAALGEFQTALPPVEPVFVAPAPPPPATLIAGSALVAVVSRGPDPTTPPLSIIPNVTGLPQEEALDGVQELGVAAQIVLAYSSEVKAGWVIAQYPTPGTPFPETQSAVLVVSRGQAAVPHVVVLPNLTGLAEDDATREIKQLGLEPFTVDAHDPEVPPGIVLTQVPSAESLAVAPVERRTVWPWLIGAAVIVLLVFGGFLLWRLNATYPVPSVIGQTQVTAQRTITDAGFSMGSVVSSPVAGVPRGAVASQVPSANAQAKLRSAVSLVISSGEPLVAIPNVVGKAESAATTELANVDLTSQAIRAFDTTVPAGNVISQFPIAGDQVLPNTVIGLVVSRGRPPAISATVPNVTGKTQGSATSAVSKAHLTSQVFTVPSASVKSGTVVGQLPPPGSLVAKQSQVYLFVSRGRVSSTTTLTASVPNLIGQTQIQAITNINSAGLVAVVSQAYSSAIPPGIVYGQVPQPGAVVSRETQVGIIVSQGPAPSQ